RVACHWAEDIAAGRIKPHAVAPELVELTGGAVDVPHTPTSVVDALDT
ncbi:MAG: dipeptide/oligopeptide/nickel ABC transporter ATP-binding protein, partial [Actinophytocola sp.]|nr:dipeptide/oligopeptide/nickel ABC transporter ATP-binding protein [Actinophytocola sp.]